LLLLLIDRLSSAALYRMQVIEDRKYGYRR